MTEQEKHRARERARYARKKDDPIFRAKAKARSKRHYEANKDMYTERAKAWRLKNRERHNFLSRRHRNKKKLLEVIQTFAQDYGG